MKDYIKGKIVERVKDRVSLMTRSMLMRNAWFKQSIDTAMVSKNLPDREIKIHFEEYRDIIFRYEAIDWEITKLLDDLRSVMDNVEFETFRWSCLPRLENEYMVEILTKSEFEVDKAA